ncbi:MAG: amidohydrolase family protein [Deltaproteobacteria bacterium]|nr:amidohydrolase family protein [Deltaproteobacteria bacterium]
MQLVTAAQLLPIDQPAMSNGAMIINNGKILAVGTAAALAAEHPAATRIDYPEHVILPGLVNAHLHVDMAQFYPPHPAAEGNQEGGAPSPHLQWQQAALTFRFENRLDHSKESIRYCAERLQHYGVTCVGALTTFDAAVPLFAGTGLRAVVFPEIFASRAAEVTQDRFESALALLEKYAGHSDRIRFGLAPLAPYLLSRQVLHIVSQHVAGAQLPLQIHAAESFEEMEFFFNSSGPIGTELFPLFGWGPATGQPLPPPFHKTPIRYLEEIGFLAAHPTIVGGVQLAADDLPILQRNGCAVVYCPQAVRQFGLGEFPYGKLREHGVPVALGTEALFTPTDGDLWAEMRAALQSGGIGATDVLHMATLGGAHALRCSDTIGSLTAGKAADYLVLDLPPRERDRGLEEALVRFTTPPQIRHRFVAGIELPHA